MFALSPTHVESKSCIATDTPVIIEQEQAHWVESFLFDSVHNSVQGYNPFRIPH